jgi:hypothetical protein
VIEPVHGLLHSGGGQLAGDGAADLAPCDQSGVRQHIEMLHDGGERHRERPRELAYRNARAAIELREQRPPRRVGESGKGAVERDVLILNHQVKYRDDGSQRQACEKFEGAAKKGPNR